ncbi:hypothetical protein X975_03702, partial [Stegodyphus mimosarum]
MNCKDISQKRAELAIFKKSSSSALNRIFTRIFSHTHHIAPTLLFQNSTFFSHLQLRLADAIFNSAQDILSEVDLFLDSWPPSFWVIGFGKLPIYWQKIIV